MRRFVFLSVALFLALFVQAQSLDSLIKKAMIIDWKFYVSRGYRPFCAYKILGVDRGKDKVFYYLIVVEAAYKVNGVYLKDDGKLVTPLKIARTRDTVIGYMPHEGEDYAESIRKIFPRKYHDAIFNRHFNADSAMWITRQKALNYWHFERLYLFYPKSWTEYENTINQYVDGVIDNPWPKIHLLRESIYLYPTDSLKYYVALNEYRLHPPFGNKDMAQISYFKQKADTVFIMLNADVEGWAGVSYFLAQVHPLIEKALFQFPDVRAVVWDYAPEDKH